MVQVPNISVIVAAFNQEKYIGRAIRSLLNQTLDRSLYEVIIIDDGSNDKTDYALNLFQDDIKILKHKINKGLPSALNTGIRAAKGKYIVRVDADDYVHSTYLEVLSEFLECNKYMDAVACDYNIVNDAEEVIKRCNCLEEPIGCGIMFRFEQLIDIGLYDEQFLMHEDYDLRIRFEKKFRIHRVELPLYRYRWHEKNMTKNIIEDSKYRHLVHQKYGNSKVKVDQVKWSGRGHLYTEEDYNIVLKAMKEADPQTQGKFQASFEKKFREMFDCGSAFAVTSCTAALELAASIIPIQPGDEVIVPAHTFAATAIPFARNGAKIVWADIDPSTMVVSSREIAPLITSKTRVIVVVHLYGLVCDMDPIMEVARKHDILVVEDCAQSLGAMYKSKYCGSIGDFGCFSFHSHKNISTLGEGGVLTVNNPRYSGLVAGMRHCGMRPFENREFYWKPAMTNVDEDIPDRWPYNFCTTEVQCALGEKLLQRNEQMIRLRRERAQQIMGGLIEFSELIFQSKPSGQGHAYHLLPMKYDGEQTGKTRDDLIQILNEKYRIRTAVQYYPLYRYPLFQKKGFGDAKCPNTDHFFDNMLSIPFHSWLTSEEIDYMIESIASACTLLRKN